MKAPEILRGRPPGFSLVEVIIAVTLLGLVLAGAFGALTQAMLFNTNAELRGVANEAIQTEIEHLRSLSWDELKALQNTATFTQEPSDERLLTERERHYDPLNAEGLMFFNVSVAWSINGKNEQRVNMIVQFTEEGITAK